MRTWRMFAAALILVGVAESGTASRSDAGAVGGQETPKQAAPKDAGATSSASKENAGQVASALPADKPDYSKEPFVIEQVRTQYRFKADGTGRKEQSLRVRVQSEAGVKIWGQMQFGYNSASERLEIPVVQVTKPDGTVVKAGPDAIQEMNEPLQRTVYSDFRQKHVIVPGLRPGDILECQLSTAIHTSLAPGQFWLQHDFLRDLIVLQEELVVDVPAGRSVKLKTKPGKEPTIKEQDGRRIYNWSNSILKREDESSEKLGAKKKKRRKQEEYPAIQLTSFASWEEVGRWYGDLEKSRRVPSSAIRAKSDELTKGRTGDLEKIEALYDYTAKNFRYVALSLGMGRYQPHAADEVLHNQYGDCKDKNTLLAALLEAAGYHSSSVLVNYGRKLDAEIPSPAQFNHVITMVPLGKEEIWMDTTTEVAPFRVLSYALEHKQGLVIPPDGTPHLEETPAESPVGNREILRIEGKVDDRGTLEAHLAYEFRGDSEVRLRQSFRSTGSADWQKIVESMSELEKMGKDITELKVSDPAATTEPFQFSYRLVKADFIDVNKKKLQLKLPLPIYGLAAAGPEDAEDSEPINIGPATVREYHVKLQLPARYSVHGPLPLSLKRDYGEYEATYKLESNVITAERRLKVGQAELPSSRVQDYLAFRRSVYADLEQQLQLETSAVINLDAGTDAKPEDLVKRGNDARKNGNLPVAITLLKRALEADPKSAGGWNDLGLAYLESYQDEAAIGAFSKAIEVNPYDPYAYNNQGRVYLRERKYAEAEKYFGKQLEIDPLDKYAHGNIGLAYLEQHKYAEALPELERAAAIAPENADMQVRMGEAYLNLNQDQKAMEAFDRALKISTRPIVWNGIAYQLAQKKVHLDVAQRYAESAVSATAASLRTISLDTLAQRDLGLTGAVASYWDTLGWVAFGQGNLEKAAKLVSAAWLLGQHSEEGDHLGQIYERMGRKEDAGHAYAQAMAARRPEDETRKRLQGVLGQGENLEQRIDQGRGEFKSIRTIHLRNDAKVDGTADFFLLLTTSHGTEAQISNVKFVGGDERLKPFADGIAASGYKQAVPDETDIRLLRRGTLTCKANQAECDLALMLPGDVRSVD